MFRVMECVANQHQHDLVILAALVCIFGSVALYILLNRSTDCVEQRRRRWLIIASIVAGFGVWATHFIAMLAYDGGMPLSFGPELTVLSVVFVVVGFGASLQILGRQATLFSTFSAGLLTTTGIALMHFTGMAAIIAPANIHYDWNPIIASYIAVIFLYAGAYFAFSKFEGPTKILLPAALSCLGVILLHFTGMSATVLVADPTKPMPTSQEVDTSWLVGAISIVTFFMIASVLISSFVDRMLTDLRGLADATLEGLAIVSQGRIIEANRQLAKLLDMTIEELIGSEPDDWLAAADGKSLIEARTQPVEASLRHMQSDIVVEIGTHAIEYRGKHCLVLAVRDLTARKQAERRVEHLAAHDALTDLPNRTHFTNVLESLCESNQQFALHALDLDRFKAVNDVFGHAAGDTILCRVADILRNNVRRHDMVARIGGDEFLVIQRNVRDVRDAQHLAQRILTAFETDMDITRDPMAVGVSIGVAVYPNDASTPEMLRHHADFALYRAKESGRGMARFFDQDMDRFVRERRELEHDLRRAVMRGQMRLMFQPLVATEDGELLGYEALLRWDHPVRGSVPPSQFIPIAEEVGAIIPIGEWVLREACSAATQWPEHINIAVNVSAVQFQLPNLPAIVQNALKDTGIAPHRLELEVTESVMLRDRDTALNILHRLKAIGVRIVMDDFGTGYSSLSNLQAFPFDKIKIDRSFVSQVTRDDSALSILKAIISLGRSLDLPVVAEGVETEAQRQIVLNEGCPQAQGFYYGAPAIAEKQICKPIDKVIMKNIR